MSKVDVVEVIIKGSTDLSDRELAELIVKVLEEWKEKPHPVGLRTPVDL